MPSTVEDRDEILQLLYRYNHAIDGGDANGWADTFTEDAVFDAAGNVLSGRDALKNFAAGFKGRRHVVANPLVQIDGDTATVRAYAVVFSGTTPSVIGVYEDELVRTPTGWRFAKRVFTLDAAS
jgi:uncharacterized protein (TIGR02246 family)